MQDLVVIATVKLVESGRGHPALANISGFPTLFGVSVTAFMCHHTLPGIITPMRTKKRIFLLLFVDFLSALAFYVIIAYTGAFLFQQDRLNDV